METRRLDEKLTVAGQSTVWGLKLDDSNALYQHGMPFDPFSHRRRLRAATLDGRTYLYAIHTDKLYRLAFDQNADRNLTVGQPPRYAVVGTPLQHKLLVPPGGKMQATVLRGPAAIQVAPDGLLTWTPAQNDLGHHDVKIRLECGEDVSFLRMPIDVLAAGADPAHAPQEQHPIQQTEACLCAGADGKSLVLVSGTELKVLSADGRSVLKKVELPQALRQVGDRARCYVGLTERSVVLIDKTSLKAREVNLPGQYPDCLTLHPKSTFSYVIVRGATLANEGTVKESEIAVIDETAGTAKVSDKAFGQCLAMDPRGKYLYSCMYGTNLVAMAVDRWGGVWEVREGAGALVAYTVQGATLKPAKAVACGDASQIAVNADGSALACRDAFGLAFYKFKGQDLKVASSFEQVGTDNGRLVMHPFLPFAAVFDLGKLTFVDHSGKALADKVDLQDDGLDPWAKPLGFSLDGCSLLIQCLDRRGDPVVRVLWLKLTRDELAKLPRGGALARPGAPSMTGEEGPEPAAAKVREKDIEALLPAGQGTKLSSREIGRKYLDSVVLIQSEEESGTGVVVGGGGYILTCQHVVGDSNRLKVSYRLTMGADVKMIGAEADVVASDQKKDLALLRIKNAPGLRAVRLGEAAKVETGDAVTAIGNPGLGDTTLNWTVTDGIVSNPRQSVRGRTLLQTSAQVNPGSSGGPLFDETGGLIGIVVLKGVQKEQVGFAVPADQVRAFLKACVSPGAKNR